MSADFVAGALDVAQDAGGAVEQALAGLGQAHAAVDAGEQGGTEFFLEPLHLACQRRLGDAQMRRGARDAAKLGDADEIARLRSSMHRHYTPASHAGAIWRGSKFGICWMAGRPVASSQLRRCEAGVRSP